MRPKTSVRISVIFSLIFNGSSLSYPKPELKRRESLRKILAGAVAGVNSGFTIMPFVTNAITIEDSQQGLPVITDSSIGKVFRRSAIQGARVADSLDEKWERFSDSLRDKSTCDKNTGRKLFDNGFRKDGTRVGNPALGALCNPEPLLPLNEVMKDEILDTAARCALLVASRCSEKDEGGAKILYGAIQDTKDLVSASYERSFEKSSDADDKRRKIFNFEVYCTLRAITNFLNKSNASLEDFQIEWGRELVSIYAPFANRKDYTSPFPSKDDELQDYDYDKESLLDALGALKVGLDQLKSGGVIGLFEISIPYDDYGSVVTIAVDDYVPIGAEILLSEQNYRCGGPIQALIRYQLDKSNINCNVDTFFIDPSTTRQSEYNPTQLLLNLSNLSKA